MKKAVMLFKALGDETRLRIIEFLLEGEKCVCEIYPYVKRAQSTVSIQLSKLESWGLISSKRDGKNIYYKIKCKAVIDLCKLTGIKKIPIRRIKC
ncbi:MAG: metalloregulator ArsR/SmtB family transcription factor [Candidatus Micrarchaeota archaeon]